MRAERLKLLTNLTQPRADSQSRKSLVSVNPYQASPTPSEASSSEQHGSSPLICVLCVLVAIHFLVVLGITISSLLIPIPIALIGGLISMGFYIAIFIGLLRKAEWARVTLIWLCYVGLVTYAFQVQNMVWLVVPLMIFELVTLVIAHSSAVRTVTQKASTAVSYTYTESAVSNAQRSTPE